MQLRTLLLSAALLLLGGAHADAQTKDTYSRQWHTVDSLAEVAGKPRSALDIVNSIYKSARAQGNDAQLIRALAYRSALQESTRENNGSSAIKELEAERKGLRGPGLALLNSLLAKTYRNYLEENRWQIQQRTATGTFKESDLNTWTLNDLNERITALYIASLRDRETLQRTALAPYEVLIRKGNVRALRPTLYDLLAHEALDYFKSGEGDLTRPEQPFEITQPEALAPAAEFARARFRTTDSASRQWRALRLFQELIAFHLQRNDAAALTEVDLERITYAYQNSVSTGKEAQYLSTLRQLINAHAGRGSYQAVYLLAHYHYEKGGAYDPRKDSTNRWEIKKALDLLAPVVRDSAVKNEGWVNSFNLWQNIQRPSLTLHTEKVNVPGAPFRSLVEYRNVPRIYLRIIALRDTADFELSESADWSAMLRRAPVTSWEQELPATGDAQAHRVEIPVSALPVGRYLLLATSTAAFREGSTAASAVDLSVSNISYLNKKNEFRVLHRSTGRPLTGARITGMEQVYDAKREQHVFRNISNYTTNAEGQARIPLGRGGRQIYFRVRAGQDSLFLNDGSDAMYEFDYDPEGQKKRTEQREVYFFTDRALYRPAQTVFFKGLAVRRLDGVRIGEPLTTTVYLRDVNGQAKDSLRLSTNEYGSFQGRFTLPAGGLTGHFSISTEGGDASFSVEEYKRPKFYVEFAAQKGSYRVDDTIRANGMVRAYAGNNIGGAKVSYRVVRAHRPIWSWWWRWPQRGEQQEITHGEATTDAQGNFRIDFPALPDRSVDSAANPVFDYTVYANVTDVNGETRSGEQSIAASYSALLVSLDMDQRVAADSFGHVPVHVTNINGIPQPVRASVTIQRLRPEQRLVRARYWDAPDQFVLPKEAFVKLFPVDEYATESDFRTWPTDSLVWEGTDTLSAKGITLGGKRLAPGFYSIRVSTEDSAGRRVTSTGYVELYRPGTLTRPEYLWANGGMVNLQPGEQGEVRIGSATDIYLLREEVRPDTATLTAQVQAAGIHPFAYRVEEKDRGGYALQFYFVRDNRLYEYSQTVNVPWTNKQLRVVYATYRNKTLPGAKEQWKLKITRADGSPVDAEVLASLYDASLDQFQPHEWNIPGLYPTYYPDGRWVSGSNFRQELSEGHGIEEADRSVIKEFDELNFGPRFVRPQYRLRGYATTASAAMADSYAYNAAPRMMKVPKAEMTKFTPPKIVADEEVRQEDTVAAKAPPATQPRKNFNETAFFYPQLHTDTSGAVELTFTLPEALTRWKLQALAHTKDLAFGLGVQEIETQKELMVQTNAPRFLRQGDHFEFSTKIANLTGKELTGQVQLELFDAATGTPVDGWLQNMFPNQYFTVAAGASEAVAFPIEIPYLYNSALTWRVTARAGDHSDAEESMMPVLSNKVLITESLPVSMRGSGSKIFRFEKLLASGGSETMQHKGLTVEYTANPAWTVVQALPYLVEYPYECAEQTWNRYYANTLAAHILEKAPKIRAVFERWRSSDTAALLSNLQKNEELKSALLEETPWVLEAQNETQQRRNIALLFDLSRLAAGQRSALQKLAAAQNGEGAFPWFPGGPNDRYITQYILSGMGRLQQLGIDGEELRPIRDRALAFLDRAVREAHQRLLRRKAKLKEQSIGRLDVQYLYLRSFFRDRALAKGSEAAHAYFLGQVARSWIKLSRLSQGQAAIALHRYGQATTAKAIIGSLRETAVRSEELGMYWKDNDYGRSPYWWDAPIETQATLIAAFTELGTDTRTVDDLRTWLLRHKQTNSWRTTTATADACYALLLQGTDWLSNTPTVTVQAGTLRAGTGNAAEAGTGYFRSSVEGAQVKPAMGNVTVTVGDAGAAGARPSWGAVYWQYFEDMDKVTRAATPLQVERRLFREVNTARGPELRPLDEPLHIGDKVTVRLILRVDRDMEFVHLKDLRASALEPVNVLSSYKWQDGLGYYESTRDVSTNFFFDQLRKGTYVFEYPLFVTHKGQFNSGLATIQCLYAPEFSAHSEGQQLTIE